MKVLHIWMLFVMLGVGIVTPSAHASPIPLTVANFSFENDVTNDSATTVVMSSWNPVNGPGTFDPVNANFAGTTGDNVQGTLPNGGQIAIITTYFGGAFNRSMSQSVGTVASNTIYTLTVAIGTRLETASGGWRIELLAGPTLAGATQIASATANSGPAAGTWADHSAVTAALALGNPSVGQNLYIQISGFNAPGNTTTAQDQFDYVRLTADAIPEPASLGLLCAGAVLSSARGRRRNGGLK